MHAHTIVVSWQCNYLSVSGVSSQHGPHCRNHFPSATMDRSTLEIKTDWKDLRGLWFFPIFQSVKHLSVVDQNLKSSLNIDHRLPKMYWFLILWPAQKMKTMWRAQEQKMRDVADKNAEMSSVCPRLMPPEIRRADKDDQPQQRWVSAGVETLRCWLSFNLYLFKESLLNIFSSYVSYNHNTSPLLRFLVTIQLLCSCWELPASLISISYCCRK